MLLLTKSSTKSLPEKFLSELGLIFARFDEKTQDSGNVSYGVEEQGHRYFVKTPGPLFTQALHTHEERVNCLRNAARLNQEMMAPCLPHLYNVIESPQGPMLVYEWLNAQLVGVPSHRRSETDSAFTRFKTLPKVQLVTALDAIFRFHVVLSERGWVASDFYDGAIMYDFVSSRTFLIDLDHYRPAPFQNDRGRMFGSTRFMAPEEFQLGALINEQTTVFTMGRCISVFMEPSHDSVFSPLVHLVDRACSSNPKDRFASMAEFYRVWWEAIQKQPTIS